MRLWHWKLIPYLPKSQLLAQWRELNSIFVKQDKHILINYIYEYPKVDLMRYTSLVLDEMVKRAINISKKSLDNAGKYFGETYYSDAVFPIPREPFSRHHTDRYLLQCYYNLQEKYDRGQKDFTLELYYKLVDLVVDGGLIR